MKGYLLHNQTDHPGLIIAENTRLRKDLKVIRKNLEKPQLSDKSCNKIPQTAKIVV